MLCVTPKIFAMPVLSPAEPALVTKGIILPCCNGLIGVKFGYRGDFVFSRKTKSFFRESYKEFNKNFSLMANEGVLTINIAEMVDIYTFLGTASYSIEGRKSLVGNRGSSIDFDLQSTTNLITGIGLKAILWEGNIGVGGRTYVAWDIAYEVMGTTPFEHVRIGKKRISKPGIGYTYREGQTSLTLGHKIKKLLPYFSFIWSEARVQPGRDRNIGTNTVSFNSLRSYKKVGYAIGVAYYDDAKMSITAEGRFADEIACTIAGNLKF